MQGPSHQRYGYLDSRRFIAASLVVMQHLFERQTGLWTEGFIRLGPGVAGVALFFFISGYAIPLSVRGELDWWRFMVRRVFRIYPLYLAALGLIFVSAVLAIVPNWIDMPGASPVPAKIVPQDKELVVKAQLSAQVAQDLHPGSSIRVRFPTIHDRSRLEAVGVITTISADVLTDERTGAHYYAAEARVASAEIEKVTDCGREKYDLHMT